MRDYIPRTDAERIARDSFRTPLIRTGQGEYVKDIHNHDAEAMLWWPWLLVCVIVAALCLIAAWMVGK